ncbi:hypothetical protein ACIQD2_13860 [Dietzia maris]
MVGAFFDAVFLTGVFFAELELLFLADDFFPEPEPSSSSSSSSLSSALPPRCFTPARRAASRSATSSSPSSSLASSRSSTVNDYPPAALASMSSLSWIW